MSAKPCDNCTMIMVNYANLWLMHSHVARLLDGARLFQTAWCCTSCPVLRSNLVASTVEIKDFKHRLDHASRYAVLTPSCVVCGYLKGKLFHATKENTEL
jgi:hypothetical protein